LDHVVTRNTLASFRCKTILEFGCGTGKNTSFYAGIAERVCALDFSAGMLEQARRKVASNRVLFAVADIVAPWPCRARSVDLAVCNLVLEHIEDLSPIFAEASLTLVDGGRFFVSELHPFRQYQGTKANFEREKGKVEIQAFTHHISDFLEAANKNALSLVSLREWWHEADENKLPRLVSFLFEK
jgi:malonyl-CoA O-methyltransferase